MKATFAPLQTAFIVQRVPGDCAVIGTEITIVEAYEERRAEPRYLVSTYSGKRFYVYESDLSTRDPLNDQIDPL